MFLVEMGEGRSSTFNIGDGSLSACARLILQNVDPDSLPKTYQAYRYRYLRIYGETLTARPSAIPSLQSDWASRLGT